MIDECDYKFSESGLYYAPAEGPCDSYLVYIRSLPQLPHPEVWKLTATFHIGLLHANVMLWWNINSIHLYSRMKIFLILLALWELSYLMDGIVSSLFSWEGKLLNFLLTRIVYVKNIQKKTAYGKWKSEDFL